MANFEGSQNYFGTYCYAIELFARPRHITEEIKQLQIIDLSFKDYQGFTYDAAFKGTYEGEEDDQT